MPHQPGHLLPTPTPAPAPPPPPAPVYTPPKFAPAGISGFGKPGTPKFGFGTKKGIWKRRQPIGPYTRTTQIPLAPPITKAQYNVIKYKMNRHHVYGPGPSQFRSKADAAARTADAAAYEAWLLNPYTTKAVTADPAPEYAARIAARDVRLAARRAASRGETTLYNYLSPQAFRRAMQRRYS